MRTNCAPGVSFSSAQVADHAALAVFKLDPPFRESHPETNGFATRGVSLSSDRSTQIKSVDVPKAKGTTDNQLKYSNPDVKNGFLTATFDNTPKSKTVGPTSALKSVTFEGDKPKNVQ